jgi:hypothetical protein
MGSLKKDAILGKRRRKVKKVEVPEWELNGADHVYVRQLSAAEAQCIAALGDGETRLADQLVTPCLLGVCDADGVRLFDDDDREQVAGLEFAALQRCVEALMELNELTDEGSAARKKD